MKNLRFKKAWNIFTTIIVVIVVLLAVLLVGVRIAGFDVYTVLSGSMEPAFHVGSLIYVKNVSPEEIQVGDPITFVLNEDLVVATHRVVEIDAENQYFYTKGDANDYVDGVPVHFNNLIGTPVFSIPYLGYFADFIQHPPGMYVAISVGAVLLLLIFLPEILSAFTDDKKDAKSQEELS
ncbi:MAG: signal peptidase I [Candidatus Fimisoma sp.]